MKTLDGKMKTIAHIRKLIFAFGVVAFTPVTAVHADTACNPDEGERLFFKCAMCHSAEEGMPHGVGPNLFGVFEHAIADAPDFHYSDALADLQGIWDEEQLDAFLLKPREFARGTTMGFAGLANPDDRAQVICYLKDRR